VFVESESKKVGQLRVPDAVFQGIQNGTWVRVEASMAQRVQYLLRDYDYFLSGPELETQLDRLKELCGGETVNRWKSLVVARDFQTLVSELLSQHYDRFYNRSMNHHAEAAAPHTRFTADDLSDAGIEALARAIAA
jgi:tRNA 2-selenouridine synthase